ncbi:MAG: DUF6895 family protein [Myxococcota bacterium]
MRSDELLAQLLALTGGGDAESIALRTLSLHMLGGHAPRFFARHGLDRELRAALERCREVSYGFDEPGRTEDRLQAGLDAWLCRALHGLPHPPPDRAALRDALAWLADESPIYAWLLGELAARLGVDERVPFASERPFAHVSRLVDAYFLTHLVLLDTDYLARPASHPQAARWADELEQLVPWLAQEPNADLAGEVAFSLHSLGRDPSAARALFATETSDDPHTVATMLLGLVGE